MGSRQVGLLSNRQRTVGRHNNLKAQPRAAACPVRGCIDRQSLSAATQFSADRLPATFSASWDQIPLHMIIPQCRAKFTISNSPSYAYIKFSAREYECATRPP